MSPAQLQRGSMAAAAESVGPESPPSVLLWAILLELRSNPMLRPNADHRPRFVEAPVPTGGPDVALGLADHDRALLAAISALVGSEEWTCAVLIDWANYGTDGQSAQLRALLRELKAETALSLGVYLRDMFARSAVTTMRSNFTLVRGRTDRRDRRCWAVIDQAPQATPGTPGAAIADD